MAPMWKRWACGASVSRPCVLIVTVAWFPLRCTVAVPEPVTLLVGIGESAACSSPLREASPANATGARAIPEAIAAGAVAEVAVFFFMRTPAESRDRLPGSGALAGRAHTGALCDTLGCAWCGHPRRVFGGPVEVPLSPCRRGAVHVRAGAWPLLKVGGGTCSVRAERPLAQVEQRRPTGGVVAQQEMLHRPGLRWSARRPADPPHRSRGARHETTGGVEGRAHASAWPPR